jgi:hypothetical protein
VDGKRVEGVFLGAEGSTEITFRHNWGGNAGEYYLVRLKAGFGDWGSGSGKERVVRRQDGFPNIDDRNWEGYLRIV